MSRREEILSKVSEVVAIPSCAPMAMAELENPATKPRRFAWLIEHDPGLTANLLKIANVSFADEMGPFYSAREALDKIGSAEVLRFVLSTGVAPAYVHKIEGYDLEPHMHMRHSVAVGLAACALGRELEIATPNYTFTAGLLAGVGKILLGAYVRVDVDSILRLALEEGLCFGHAEQAVLGVDHAEVGAHLLESWKIPEPITRVVRHHLRPDEYEGTDTVLDLVHMGNALAKMIGVGLGADGLNYRPSDCVAERLSLSAEIVDAVSQDVVAALDEMEDLFEFACELPR